MTNEELIEKAKSTINRHYSKDMLFGDVGAALVSEKGDVYTGVCLGVPGVGICAERNAITSMVTQGEYKVSKIVAVWEDKRDGKLYVLPPCGTCRQFMQYVDETNLDAEVVLGKDKTERLKNYYLIIIGPNHSTENEIIIKFVAGATRWRYDGRTWIA